MELQFTTKIHLSDGNFLSATLYIPSKCNNGDKVPVLLEVLPYRKDDITAHYRPEYIRFRDEFGYAVCRVDVRGTGSSTGILEDEYTEQEHKDTIECIEWLSSQDWCNGSVGMFGTSYSGFNSLQVAVKQPKSLKAICSIYASDDRFNDDVHYSGGNIKLLDQIDYPLYMLSLNALPPVPKVFGENWRDEWLKRLENTVPWQINWLKEQNSKFWKRGSVRYEYDKINIPTMLICGWADGYKNIAFRAAKEFIKNKTPINILIGPWSHQSPEYSIPGPNVDHVSLMAKWFDTYLKQSKHGLHGAQVIKPLDMKKIAEGLGAERRGKVTATSGYFGAMSTSCQAKPSEDLTLFVREWKKPNINEFNWNGYWISTKISDFEKSKDENIINFPKSTFVVDHIPTVGISAWNSCAGGLPWGQPSNQIIDNSLSVCFDTTIEKNTTVIGNPKIKLRVKANTNNPTIVVHMCSVKNNESLLISSGILNMCYRNGLNKRPSKIKPGKWYDVEIELNSCAYNFKFGETLRFAISNTEFPNIIASPKPNKITINGEYSFAQLPICNKKFKSNINSIKNNEVHEPSNIVLNITNDVINDKTILTVEHGSSYDSLYNTFCVEKYVGNISIDHLSWNQHVSAYSEYDIKYDEINVNCRSELTLIADSDNLYVKNSLIAKENEITIFKKSWEDKIKRNFG